MGFDKNERARRLLASVGLAGREDELPSRLSGGEQQRVAIARALVTRPEVLFADEPTGALDIRTGRDVLALLRELVDQEGQTVVMVTHDPAAATYADRVILLDQGRLVASDSPQGLRTTTGSATLAEALERLTPPGFRVEVPS